MDKHFESAIKECIKKVNPKLRKLADGYVEFVKFDPGSGRLWIRTVGGRLC